VTRRSDQLTDGHKLARTAPIAAKEVAKAAPERHPARTPTWVATDAVGPLLDYEGAAAYLAVSERHIRELWAKRRLAAVKVGRSVRFSRADLDAFIASNRIRAVR
jgi:excisionase family DNA binding protein